MLIIDLYIRIDTRSGIYDFENESTYYNSSKYKLDSMLIKNSQAQPVIISGYNYRRFDGQLDALPVYCTNCK